MLRILSSAKQSIHWRNQVSFGTKAKKYILSQFPYPSGQLHLGHARVYYIGDSLARYYKLRDFDVIYPIGFDSFGLPAQNAAIVHGKSPRIWTQNNINLMKDQLNSLNINFDWDRQICTHSPEYYKWTQQIFTAMFRKGLVVKAESQVNWDPIDKTVLANEQVDMEGRSWRSGAIVEKKMLSQWFFKITDYAQELQSNLVNLQWIERVKSMQAGWIGFRRGHLVEMQIINVNSKIAETNLDENQLKQLKQQKLKVYVNQLGDLQQEFYIRYNRSGNKENSGQAKGQQIIIAQLLDPVSKKTVPVIVGQQQNGTRFELVLSNQKSVSKQTSKQSISVNSQPVSIMRIKDWSISRQRYWGTPIPIIHCGKCGALPVPSQQLPVILPEWKGEGNPLLTEQFKSCKCPKCGGVAQREMDTMDTFVDSSWYFLRFLDPQNRLQVCNKTQADRWMPVDVYIGGIQHAIMHLLYARFFMRVLSDLKVCQIKQPFKQLVVQGLVKGKAVRHKTTGKYLKPSEIQDYSPNDIEETYEKMSKSKFNGLNPQHLVNKFGPDALRIALFFASPPEHDIDFHEELLVSADRFLKRVQEMHKRIAAGNQQLKLITDPNILKQKIAQFCNNHNKQSLDVKRLIGRLQISVQRRQMHVCIANMMELFNLINDVIKQNNQDSGVGTVLFGSIFAPIFSVFAPTTTRNLFNIHNDDLRNVAWPSSDYFLDVTEYLLMKGSKLIKKGVICSQQPLTEAQIRTKLQVPENAVIKINKKGIVIIIK